VAVGGRQQQQPGSEGQWTRRIILLMQEYTNIISPSSTMLSLSSIWLRQARS
jgi:hypothetical protein